MTQRTEEPEAIALLRDIVEGDDNTMVAALTRAGPFLRALRVAGAKVRRTKGDCFDEILALVAGHYNVTAADMLGANRRKDVALARQVVFWLCRNITKAPFEDIARRFDKHHGTVMWGVKVINNYRDVDKGFSQELADLQLRADKLCSPEAKP